MGCDSIATLKLTIKATSTSTTNVSVCSTALPFTWNETAYGVAGTYTKTLVNAVGCDSVATLVLSVTTAVTPSVSIVTSATTICVGSSVTFTATPINGGSVPAYQWKKGGIAIVGATASTYTVNSLNNNDVISCVLTANNACQTAATAISNNVTILWNTTSINTWTGNTSTNYSTSGNWCTGTVPTTGAAITIPVVSSNNYPVMSSSLSTNSLTLNAGAFLSLGGNTLTLTGITSGTGFIKGYLTSSIVVNSTSTPTIYFNPAIGDSLLNTLTISGSGGAKLGNGVGITNLLSLIAGNLNLNGNHLTLKSTSIANTAVVGPVTTGATITGNITVERYIPKGYKAYRQLGTGGVYNAGSIFNNWQEGGNKTAGYGLFVTGSKSSATGVNATTGLDNTTNGAYNFYNYSYYETWNPVRNAKTAILDPYTGYHVFIYGDRTTNLYTPNFDALPAMTNATTLRTTGQLVSGTVTFTSTGVTGVYNSSVAKLLPLQDTGSFIANPYPCAVDWEKLTSQGLTANYFYFDPTFLDATGYQSYVAYNSISHVNSNPIASKMNKYIQPGQGFWVQTNSVVGATRQLIFTEAAKVINQPFTAIFGNASSTANLIATSLWKNIKGVGVSNIDGAVAVFNNQFSKQTGAEDAKKMVNEKENIAIAELGGHLSIDGIPEPKEGDRLPLVLYKLVAGTDYQLRLDARSYHSDGLQTYLKDALLNKLVPLSTDKTVYSFTANDTLYSNRFSLVFGAKLVSPIANVEAAKPAITVYPNPISGKSITVKLANTLRGNYQVVLYNVLGQRILSKEINHNGGTESYHLLLPSGIVTGAYTIVVTNQYGIPVHKTTLFNN